MAALASGSLSTVARLPGDTGASYVSDLPAVHAALAALAYCMDMTSKRGQGRETTEPRRRRESAKDSDCLLPHKPSTEALRGAVLDRSEREEAAIIEYAEWQLSKGAKRAAHIGHLEKMKSERVFGRQYDLWDVHTSAGRWWVVTNPTNIYSQREFPSADYLMSFHIGVTLRVMQRDQRTVQGPSVDRFAGAIRRWQQAAKAIDEANEAEDFQAVGMKCRECLLTFVRDAQADVPIQAGTERPKRGDFTAWAGLIADWAAPGDHSKDVRQHLKTIADSTWQLVNWLTHARNATLSDAELVVSATNHLLEWFSESLMRRESERPERCPKCSSYQVESFYAPELELDPPYLLTCLACGWEQRGARNA